MSSSSRSSRSSSSSFATTTTRSLFTTILPTLLLSLSSPASAFTYDERYLAHNLNQNPNAKSSLDYWGQWENHTYHPSPSNWRFPFYTLFLDRFVNGDPTNDNANGTLYEQDIMSTQLRFGGDVQGLLDSLDYIQGMGIKGLYIAGSPFMNQPWVADSYSPLDHTILDEHFGNITAWREAIDEIHRRGMYIMLDNTVATMGDLLGFEGYLNESTPFKTDEYKVQWKSERRYADFEIGIEYNETCTFPRMWNETGYPVDAEVMAQFQGCYNGDFDQFGDTEAFGVYPDYRRQLTKFASVQDRLREWVPSVRERLEHFSCMTIAMLDIDGFRYDKATQATLDATGQFSSHLRACAVKLGKKDFFLPGEITGGNTFGALYVGRGRQPDQYITDLTTAAGMNNFTAAEKDVQFLREEGQGALDAAAFHYSIYRFLTRFLGMDGNLAAGFDLPTNWVESWNQMLLTNDFINPNTNQMDPRHMYGATNQDVFRWPAISQGIDRMLLGMFITTLHMPGIPLLLWGEEQAFTILDSTADNYIYGRQSMSSSPAWQAHGCYALGSAQYFDMPLEHARTACTEEAQSWDHRDPSHPIRNIVKAMYHLRNVFPVLQDGLFLQQLSNMTKLIQLPGSSGVPTETGLWSVVRSAFPGVQDLGATSPIWFVYHNDNATTTKYDFSCSSTTGDAMLAPFPAGTTVKNLFFPHDEIELTTSATKLGINGSKEFNGCTDSITLKPFEYRAYVPKAAFVPPPAMITKFLPGHDAHIDSSTLDKEGQVQIELHVSAEMDCNLFTDAIEIVSVTSDPFKPNFPLPLVNASSVKCEMMTQDETPPYIGAIGSAWKWTGTVMYIHDGVHEIVVRNATTSDLGSRTNAVDRFLLRVGDRKNPVVFPTSGNYSSTLLAYAGDENDDLVLNHDAPGASKWRYSLNWGSSWSDWRDYSQSTPTPIERQAWTGTAAQEWDGEHVMVQYWSRLLGSSSFMQHGDIHAPSSTDVHTRRRFPHLFANGKFNMYGYDAGVDNQLRLTDDSLWEYHFAAEWPGQLQLNVWGMNPDGQPDQSFVYGDIDGDFVLDRLPPSSLVESVINVTHGPGFPHLAYKLKLNDGTFRYELEPVGSAWEQLALYILLWVGPLLGGVGSVLMFRGSFYKVKFVKMGLSGNSTFITRGYSRFLKKFFPATFEKRNKTLTVTRPSPFNTLVNASAVSTALSSSGQTLVEPPKRRTVLIATMEYNIDDWDIKIKIGGLGVMASLMGKSLEHQDLIWVVPCVSGVEYPIDTRAEPIIVTILDDQYEVQVQYHKLGNITFVLVDAPVFRKQTKAEPYPPRMDDLESAVYYSAWNQCIAETARRFPIDLYHINDYHGAAAPLYLLPKTIPCCLSLHNAEFQGMWPMRSAAESREVCSVFNLDKDIVARYIQFGSVFNLLHAGASYLRIHQKGFGTVGVSKKYGDRSFARYAIFWGLSGVGQLPNPDPTDVGEWDKEAFMNDRSITINNDYESSRADLKRQAQEWAGLTVNPKADLFVFVGRWSLQKGVDLIADIFPEILEKYPDAQLICIGPLIDLYGKFAALKLSKMMDKYPGRVFSKPEFTALPPFIFSGAEFALIPSRDEPFGLVAVEFGRKGALGVGARVGGLGQMPGWWYTIESTSAAHLLAQFKEAIVSALETKQKTRAKMRAWSAKQRFPVAQWLEDLEILQSTSIDIHYGQGKNAAGSAANSVKSGGKKLHKRNPSQIEGQKQEERLTPAGGLFRVQPSHDGDDNEEQQQQRQGRERSRSRVSRWGRMMGGAGSRSHSATPSEASRARSRSRSHVRGQSNGSNHSGSARRRRTSSFSSEPRAKLTKAEPKRNSARSSKVPSLALVKTRSNPQRAEASAPAVAAPRISGEHTPGTSSDDEIDNADVYQVTRIMSMTTPPPARMFDLSPPSSPESPNFPARPGSSSSAISSIHGGNGQAVSFAPVHTSAARNVPASLSMPTSAESSAVNSPRHIRGVSAHRESYFAEPINEVTDSDADLPPVPPFAGLPAGPGQHITIDSSMRPGLGSRVVSTLSMQDVVGSRSDFELMNVSPFFTDSNGDFYKLFSRKLDGLTSHNSSTDLCIEDYLVKSEKEWFTRYRNAKLGRLSTLNPDSARNSRPASGAFSTAGPTATNSRANSPGPMIGGRKKQSGLFSESAATSKVLKGNEEVDSPNALASTLDNDNNKEKQNDPERGAVMIQEREYDPKEFGLGEDYKPPTGLQKYLQFRLGDWPIYSILLALGQVISSNSYQITLLTGEIGQTATKLYIIASIYFATTGMWYLMVRRVQAVYALTLPFFFYGLAFLLLGFSPFAANGNSRWYMQNAATAIYATASSSGAVAFASNFGDEGGSPLTVWIYRATIIQGLQQLYSLALWYWGSIISSASAAGLSTSTSTANLAASPYLLAVCLPICLLLWAVGAVLYVGLPDYYREAPGAVPMLWRSLIKRKTIAWFLLAVVVQNYFLSAPYGRNWSFLFNTNALNGVPAWSIILLALAFFIIVWSGILLTLSKITKSHPWLFPIFAIGLGAPRWAQMLWGVSPIGLYLPFITSGPVGQALASRALWLWLGVLDGLQGAGIGMILMLTLTRIHVLAAVVAAQLLGTAATIAARASAPDAVGPGPVFPDITKGFAAAGGAMHEGWFWGVLVAQLVLCVGYLKFFRKEQVNKP